MRDTLEQRFWSKVRRTKDGCWEWTGRRARDGYGVFDIRNKRFHKRETQAHRVAWLLTHGGIGAYKVLHTCDVRHCVNPAHLFLGTQADNMADMIAKGRKVSSCGEKNGYAKLTAEDVLAIRKASSYTLQRELAARYGVTQSAISRIVNRDNWVRVP